MTKVILLSAGYGTRLQPLTNSKPKTLMPIKGKALLSIWLERLTAAGFGPFLINTHYLHNQIDEFVRDCEFKNTINISYEKKLLGTAGTLIKNLEFFEDGGMLVHADNYCLADFKAFLEAHQKRPKQCVMTMMTFKTENKKNSGIVEVDRNSIITNFYEKDKNACGNIANGAIYLLSNEMIEELRYNFNEANDFSTQVIPKFMNKIYTYHTEEPLIDIGSKEDYLLANKIDSNL